MRTIVLATALALAASAPALAKSTDVMHHARAAHHMTSPNAAVAAPDPYGVYIEGQEIGRDPDPNIRSTLRDEYYEMQSGG